MTLHVRAKVLLHVCSYDFYDTKLSTETSYDKYDSDLLFQGSSCDDVNGRHNGRRDEDRRL